MATIITIITQSGYVTMAIHTIRIPLLIKGRLILDLVYFVILTPLQEQRFHWYVD